MRRNRMKQTKRAAALLVASALLVTGMPLRTLAAPPRVQTDETMYVNLDPYGSKTKVNVVKGLNVNGVTEYRDYGRYEKVVNMTDRTEPLLEDGTVVWNLPEDANRFYYQCTMDEDRVELPWNFDVSYSLNGREMKAEELAGASGVIEIHVHAMPNRIARAYYRNNMILSVVVPVDMEKCYSVDAPGSQLQSLGSTAAVMFAALPGEEGDFTVRIGTDHFESVGVIMMMLPGTLDTLNHVKSLNEAKNTWREDGEKLYEGMNALLAAMESMSEDAVSAENGVSRLEQARRTLSANRKAVENLSAQAISEFASVTEQTSALIPHLETAQSAVRDLNYNAEALSNSMEDMQDDLDDLYDRLGALQRTLNTIVSQMQQSPSGAALMAVPEDAALLASDSDAVLQSYSTLGEDLQQAQTLQAEGEDARGRLSRSLEEADAFRYDRGEEEELTGPSGETDSGDGNDEDTAEWNEEMDPFADEVEAALQALPGTLYLDSAASALDASSGLTGIIASIHAALAGAVDKIETLNQTMGTVSGETAATIGELRQVTDDLISLLDDIRVMIDTCDTYEPELTGTLADSEELLRRLNRAMSSTHSLLDTVNTTLTAAGANLDAGAAGSLQGLQGMLNKSIEALEHVGEIRAAGESMKKTLDEELDEFEEENNFLNMDPEAEMISFTSSRNPTPHSLQIVLRTDEISDENVSSDISDFEDIQEEDVGPFRRMWNVVVKMFHAVTDIFKER